MQGALDEIRQALPFRRQRIDSDKDSEFINASSTATAGSSRFSARGAAYKKDDNAHIE